jgi:hypothetical protein
VSEAGRGSGPVRVIFCLGGAGMEGWEVDDSASESESESDSDSGSAALDVEADADASPKKLSDAGRATASLALAFPLLFLSFFWLSAARRTQISSR